MSGGRTQGGQGKRPGVLAALAAREYRRFFAGQLISVVGTWLQIVAEGLLIYQLTRSTAWLGIVAGAGAVPALLLGLWGGQVADRYPRRDVLMVTQSALMLLAFLLAALASGEWVSAQPWQVAALTAATSAVNAFTGPAYQSFLSELVSPEARTSAIALNSMLWSGARVLGPMAAVLIIQQWGMTVCFLLNGLSFVASLIALAGIHRRARPAVVERLSALEGLRYVGQDTTALRVMVLFGVSACFGWAYQTLLPALAREQFGRGADGVGALMAAAGIGSLGAGLLTAALPGEPYRRWLVYGGALVYPVALALFATTHHFAVGLSLAVLMGFGLIACAVNISARLQERVPDELRGRVMAIFSLLFISLQPLGGLMAGLLAHSVGTASTVRLFAAISLAASTALFLWSQEEQRARARHKLTPALGVAP
jgi:MFS family permease